MATINITGLATQELVINNDLTKLNVGEAFLATITSFRPISTKLGNALQVTGKTPAGNFQAIINGTLADGLAIKGLEVKFIFKGITNSNGKDYPKLSVDI